MGEWDLNDAGFPSSSSSENRSKQESHISEERIPLAEPDQSEKYGSDHTPEQKTNNDLTASKSTTVGSSISQPPQALLATANDGAFKGPRFTKTGRISKAQKGTVGAHSCGCGKVCTIPLFSFRLMSLYISRHDVFTNADS